MKQDISGDREQLELAAKAAGIELIDRAMGAKGYIIDGAKYWNPLTDDGDALRLAVKLHLFDLKRFFELRLEETRGNPALTDYEITRRAIVRAAAEIGRKLEGGAA